MGCQCRGHAAGSRSPCRRPALVLQSQRSCMGSTSELRRLAKHRQDQSVHAATLTCMGVGPRSHSASAREQVMFRAPLYMRGQPLQVAVVARQQSPTLE